MDNYLAVLNADPRDWLLEPDNPSVKYLTMTELLGWSESEAAVKRARREIMKKAIDLVVSKQDERGRWNLETTYNGRFQVNIERKGKPSKWITLNALRVLKAYLD